jgi:hypothetical protein
MTGRVLVATVLSVVLGAVAAGPTAFAQTTFQPTATPIVTAENEPWFLGGEPITYSGSLYYPTGPQVYFNRYEMVRSGSYRGIPLFVRPMIEPFSKVYVPVAGGLMHPYERRREGDLAGTVGSSTPSFPVQTASEQYRLSAVVAGVAQASGPPSFVGPDELAVAYPLDIQPPTPPQPVATSGTPDDVALEGPKGPLATARRPKGLNGVFIEFNGRRWFSTGPAIEYDAARFTVVGSYRGFTVYADRADPERSVYVVAARDTPTRIVPYATRE